jgi:Lon protease-like protein
VSRRLEIPLFPLSGVVLFPGVQTPLHIFEMRYRQMTEHVISQGGCIGMVAVPPEHSAGLPGDPPVYPIGCAGVITQSQRLRDGRFNIVLAGAQRFRIARELPRPPGRLYRVADVELLEDPFPTAERARVAKLRARVVELVRQLIERSDPERAQQITPELFAGMDDAGFVNSLSSALSFAPSEKQGLLEAESVPARFDRLEGLLEFRLAELAVGGAQGSNSVH